MAQWQKGSITFSTNQTIPANDTGRPSQQRLDYRIGSQLGVLAVVTHGNAPLNKFVTVKLQVSIDDVNYGTFDKLTTVGGSGAVNELPFKDIPDGWSYVRLFYESADQTATVTFAVGGFGLNYS